jgi:hypothetical protein
MEKGTVILDDDDRMWLCVIGSEEQDDDLVLGPINCLMSCADQVVGAVVVWVIVPTVRRAEPR